MAFDTIIRGSMVATVSDTFACDVGSFLAARL